MPQCSNQRTSERAQLLSAMTHPSTVLDLDAKQSFVTPKSYIYIYIYIQTHPEEDRQVGRNIDGLYNVSYLHLCLIYIYIYIVICGAYCILKRQFKNCCLLKFFENSINTVRTKIKDTNKLQVSLRNNRI